jgi:hypothetical protein
MSSSEKMRSGDGRARDRSARPSGWRSDGGFLVDAVSGRLGDGHRGVAQRDADFVDGQLHAGALLTLAGLKGTLPQSAGHDHSGTFAQAVGKILCALLPHRAAQEQSVAVDRSSGTGKLS